MLETYEFPVYDYIKSDDQSADKIVHHPLIIVGAGPVGMAAALDAGVHGVKAVVLDDNNTVSVGSRAVCYSKRALEIMNRLGCAKPMVEKGVTWKVGKVFFRDELIRQFDLLPAPGHEQPAFINLQQYYFEEYLVNRSNEMDSIDLRWKNKVTGLDDQGDTVVVTVETPDGPYQISCDWLVVADGANSDVRAMMGLESSGKIFQDRFLIADIVMKADFPPERWFSFDPSYHRGWSTLLHRQADDVWRLDFQLGWDADPEEEQKPENIIPRVKAMLGEEREFELEWASVYTFTCRRMEKFRHGRVIYTGDAAHQVSPFGARGANSGVQDTDNLIWKLKLVMDGKAPETLLDSYSQEREFAADENIMNSTRATDFITPKTEVSKVFRNAVLELARDYAFAQDLTNSGRLSDPAVLYDSSLNTQDEDEFAGEMVPGAVVDDATINTAQGESFFLNSLGNRFNLLYFRNNAENVESSVIDEMARLQDAEIPIEPIVIANNGTAAANIRTLIDTDGYIRNRFDMENGSCYLVRPDQHVAARWRQFDRLSVEAALARATGNAGDSL